MVRSEMVSPQDNAILKIIGEKDGPQPIIGDEITEETMEERAEEIADQ